MCDSPDIPEKMEKSGQIILGENTFGVTLNSIKENICKFIFNIVCNLMLCRFLFLSNEKTHHVTLNIKLYFLRSYTKF